MKSLLEILAESDIKLTQGYNGRSVGHCPFHTGDHTPSFTVYPNESYYCFGCGAWGDAVKFLIDYKNMDPKAAYEYVGQDIIKEKATGVIKVKNVSETWQFLYDVAFLYHQFLWRNRGAMEYLLRRGLTEDTIKKYLIGYTDGFVLNISNAFDAALGAEVGLINKDGVEALSHRIIIPNIIASTEMVDFMVGRTVINDRVKYLGLRMPKPIIGLAAIQPSPVVFLVEGQFDWLTLKQWGYPAISAGGTNISRPNIASIKDKRVVIIPDYDQSGIGMSAAHSLEHKIDNGKTMILDYSSLRVGDDKLDISKLGERLDGERLFAEIVKEKLPWLGALSNRTIQTFFPNLTSMTHFQSTWKPAV